MTNIGGGPIVQIRRPLDYRSPGYPDAIGHMNNGSDAVRKRAWIRANPILAEIIHDYCAQIRSREGRA